MNPRWKFDISSDFILTATPEVEEMLSFVSKASKELEENIMEREERLILTAVSNAGLKRMVALCEAELGRRKTGSEPAKEK